MDISFANYIDYSINIVFASQPDVVCPIFTSGDTSNILRLRKILMTISLWSYDASTEPFIWLHLNILSP